MIYRFLIVVFLVTRLSAQLPPQLRCLRVQAGGDVVLSWIPAADPGNFNSYIVFSSLQKNGPYTQVNIPITSVATFSALHTTTVTTVQSVYYYMAMTYGAGGVDTTAHSDTLRTIFLNPTPASVALDLKFNYLRIPKLPSSAATYDINKEYPLGTWNILASTTASVYPDTIDVCNAKINYQVSLGDASGCESTSNLIVGRYGDTKPPEQPYVDSISVLASGETVIGWKVPLDRDVIRYKIQYRTPPPNPTNQLIDSVEGRNNTFYTYTTPSAGSGQVGLFVQAEDSCGSGSTVNYELRSMFLQASYNFCAYSTQLRWSRYYWATIKGQQIESTKEYRVYCSVNGSAFLLIGTTTDTNFVHNDVDPAKNVCYFVRVVNNREPVITASSNRACFFSGQVGTPGFIYAKTATVPNNSSVEIRVYIDNSKQSKGITIQRSDNDTDFVNVGYIPFTGEAHYSYVDESAQPASKSYYYRAVVIDSCGNARNPSKSARTMLLRVKGDETQLFIKQLGWNAYQGFGGGISGYNIYRIINDDISGALIGSTDALTTTYTDNIEEASSQGAKIEYRIEAVEGISNPYGISEISLSNTVPVYMEGNLYVPNAFAPGGVNKTWRPITYFIGKTEYSVKVFNRWGRTVFESSDDTQAWDGANCPTDVYVYLINYKNARGEYLEKKGTVTLLR